MAELSLRFALLQPTPIQQWKQMLLDEGVLVFARGGVRTAKSSEPHAEPNELHRKLGERTMERDFLKEKLCPCSLRRRNVRNAL